MNKNKPLRWQDFSSNVFLRKGDYIRNCRGAIMEVENVGGSDRDWFLGRWLNTGTFGYCFLLDVVDYVKFKEISK
jgi:hypothetical protein